MKIVVFSQTFLQKLFLNKPNSKTNKKSQKSDRPYFKDKIMTICNDKLLNTCKDVHDTIHKIDANLKEKAATWKGDTNYLPVPKGLN